MTPTPTGAGPAIVMQRVSKSYNGLVALAPLSLEIEAGERLAVLGPSGSGKTTLLHLLGGVIQADHGSIDISGRPLDGMSQGRELADLVGLMHQQLDLVPNLPVVHNVLSGRLGHWGIWRSLISLVSARDKDVAVEALRRVGLAEKLNERTSWLSGGEQQRVAMARLLVQRPRIILVDEPVASLDPARAKDLIKLLTSIVTEFGNTLVGSLHSVSLTRSYFSRAIGLRSGELQFDLPVMDLTDEVLDDLYDL